MTEQLRKVIDAIRARLVQLFWPRAAISDIQASTEATRATVGMILRNTQLILGKQELLMGKIDDLKLAFDEATTAIAARIERILEGQDDAVVAALQPELDRLRALGSDPVEPVPPVPPVDDPAEPATPVEPTV